MNSRQRRKANRAYNVIRDFVVIRLRMKGDVTEEQIDEFKQLNNFLIHRLSPNGSYWTKLNPVAHVIGMAHYAKATYLEHKNRTL